MIFASLYDITTYDEDISQITKYIEMIVSVRSFLNI